MLAQLHRKLPTFWIVWVVALFLAGAPLTAEESEMGWTQWRGPNGQGHSTVKHLPSEWSETSNVRWKTELPGRGWSSPVILDGEIWVTAAIETETSEAEAKKRLEGNTGGQPVTLLDKVVFYAIGVDAKSGQLLHNIELMTEEDPQWVHRLNSFASPTPVIEKGRLYCHFGTFGTSRVDTTKGEVLWRNRELPLMHENGPGSSPILWKDKIIFHGDGSDVQFVAALQKDTGKVAWKVERSGEMNKNPQLKKAYATPAIATSNGKDQVISPGADWLYSYDPESGKELWKLPYETLGFSNVPPPLIGEGMIYLTTSFMRAQMLGIRHDGKSPPEIVWRYKKNVPTTPAPIAVGDRIYFSSDQGGMVTCIDAKNGVEVWKERIQSGHYSAAPVYADGKIYFFCRDGVTTVIKPGDQLEVVGKSKLDGKIFASAALADESLFLRTDGALYRIAAP